MQASWVIIGWFSYTAIDKKNFTDVASIFPLFSVFLLKVTKNELSAALLLREKLEPHFRFVLAEKFTANKSPEYWRRWPFACLRGKYWTTGAKSDLTRAA